MPREQPSSSSSSSSSSASPSSSSPHLGIGKGRPPRSAHQHQPSRSVSNPESSHPSSESDNHPKKRRKSSAKGSTKTKNTIHFGNAREVLQSDIDLNAVLLLVKGGKVTTVEELLNVMISNVKGTISQGFSSTTDEQVKRLGVKKGEFYVGSDKKRALVALGKEALGGCLRCRELVRQHVWTGTEAGCRMAIDQLLLPAVAKAQEIHSINPIQFFGTSLPSPSSRPTFLSIYPELPMEITLEGNENGGEVKIKGAVDYVLSVITPNEHDALLQGDPTPAPPTNNILTILEAKGRDTFQSGENQVIMQTVAGLKSTGRSLFAGFLTNGVHWRCYIAVAYPNDIKIYKGPSYNTQHESQAEEVIGLLTTLIVNPGQIPEGFDFQLFA